MASIKAYGRAEVTVPAGQSVFVASYGNGITTVSGTVAPGNSVPRFMSLGTVSNNSSTFGPYAFDRTVRIDAGPAEVEYSVGLAPEVRSKATAYISALTNPYGFDMIGDSRTADLIIGNGLNSRNWFNQACARYNQVPLLIGAYGAAGKRSDQYLTNGNFELALASTSKWLIFGYPAVNDISQSATGYTDTFGRAITAGNVAAYACDNIISYAKRAVSAGKSVIILTEAGATTLAAAQVASVHEFNRLLKLRIAEVPGAILYDPCPLIWNATSSATLIAFKTNFSGDGTHAQQMAARVVGIDFAQKVLPSLIPADDFTNANISDSVANGTNQIYRNPLFNTLTGGTAGGNFTLTSGNIPANMTISGSASAGLAATITSAANASGYGNDITLNFSSTGAVGARIDLTLTTTDWNLTDLLEGFIDMDVASGGTNVSGVYAEMMIQTDAGTNDLWANYSGNSGPMATTGDTGLRLRTRKGGVVSGSASKVAAQMRIWVLFSAAGSQSITLRRPQIMRY